MTSKCPKEYSTVDKVGCAKLLARNSCFVKNQLSPKHLARLCPYPKLEKISLAKTLSKVTHSSVNGCCYACCDKFCDWWI